MFGFTGVLAHQGGWDEVLLVAAPIVVFVVLLRVANARAAYLGDHPEEIGPDAGGARPPAPDGDGDDDEPGPGR
jgi:hypothetical protein